MRRQRQSLSSTRLIRSANAVAVLRMIYTEGSCSRTRLTQLTRMSPSTITRIVTELIGQGFLTESGTEESNGGRKPVILSLNYDRIFITGIQVLRDRVDLAVFDLKGTIVAKRSFDPYSLEPAEMIKEIADEFKLLTDDKAIRERIIGVGVAISGIVDSVNGVLLCSTNLGWRGVEIARDLEEALGFPVAVENDANAAALAELWFGKAKDVSSLLYIKTDRGVGTGVIHERSLLSGVRGMAGEIGHVPLMRPGQPCRCGQKGCLETYLYLPDILRRYEIATGERLSRGHQLFARARDGDLAARQIVDEAAEALSLAVSFAAGLLDLDMVIIGGVWGKQGEDFLERIRQRYQAVLEGCGLSKEFAVRGSGFGEDDELLGAVGLVINRWFTPPIQASDVGQLFSNHKRTSSDGGGSELSMTSKHRRVRRSAVPV